MTSPRTTPAHPPQVSGSANDRPVLSVVCVVLRDPQGLLRTLASLPVGRPQVEVIVVDGENSPSLSLSTLVEAEVARLSATVVSGPDSGPYDAMNRGILASTGDWLWFLNAGDERHPSLALESLLAELDESPSVWAVGAVDLVAGERVTLNRAATATEVLHGLASQCHQGAFFHRRGIMTSGLYDTRYRIAADYNMMCRFALADEPHQLGGVVATFYRGGISTTMRRRLYLEFFLVRFRTQSNGVGFVVRDLLRAVKRALLSSKLPHAQLKVAEGKDA